MLRQLNIENVAVIEKADIEFDGGFNVLTGETGAGKSILIDSINAILGNRTSREIVRSGADKSVIWAMFDSVSEYVSHILEDNGYGFDGTLIIYREITADGKSICRINNKPSTAALVREVCSSLVNIHGQHDSQALLNPEKHIYILDSFAELDALKAEYQKVFMRLVEVKKELESLSSSEQEKQAELDLLSFQVDEIEKAKLSVEEEAELNARRQLIRSSEKLVAALKTACEALDSEDIDVSGAVSRCYDASQALDSIAELSDDTRAVASRMSEAYYSLSELASDIRSLLDGLDFDENEAEQLEERLDLIYRLKQKYGANVSEILEYQQRAAEKISGIEHATQRLAELNAECKTLISDATARAQELSDKRVAAFEVFAANIKSELEFLNMPGISFTLNRQKGALTKNGFDDVEFYISPNPGEPPKSLSKIASGGELSRIMLAIKNVLADKDEIQTLIFDEIDTGISGTSAQRVAEKLKQAAETRQIICVTHSAPIAAYSNAHLLIKKDVRDGRTYTTVSRLEQGQRREQLARMISGDNITQTALDNAQEMLDLAEKRNK